MVVSPPLENPRSIGQIYLGYVSLSHREVASTTVITNCNIKVARTPWHFKALCELFIVLENNFWCTACFEPLVEDETFTKRKVSLCASRPQQSFYLFLSIFYFEKISRWRGKTYFSYCRQFSDLESLFTSKCKVISCSVWCETITDISKWRQFILPLPVLSLNLVHSLNLL